MKSLCSHCLLVTVLLTAPTSYGQVTSSGAPPAVSSPARPAATGEPSQGSLSGVDFSFLASLAGIVPVATDTVPGAGARVGMLVGSRTLFFAASFGVMGGGSGVRSGASSSMLHYGASAGARYYLGSDTTSWVFGAGLTYSSLKLERKDAASGPVGLGNGPGAYAELGLAFYRTRSIGFDVLARVDVPWYRLTGEQGDTNNPATVVTYVPIIGIQFGVSIGGASK